MDAKTTYETCAAVAAALPEAEREMFAELLVSIARPNQVPSQSQARAAVRWAKDAGWVAR